MRDMNMMLCGVPLKNPVIAASGTFGFGEEYQTLFDVSRLGGIALKAVTKEPREGNPPPRIAETASGILNSIGLQNPGLDGFMQHELPFLKTLDTVLVANVAGKTVEDYCEVTEALSSLPEIDIIELNVSCPNVKEGCLSFGSTPDGVHDITTAVKKHCKKPLMVKLTPNTTDIASNAKAAEEAGADAISLINTLTGMVVDVHTRRPILANITGGLSGPAIMPVALHMVHTVYKEVSIPVVGMGGIMSGEDAIAFMLAGASAVMVGTAGIADSNAWLKITDEIGQYMEQHGIEKLQDIIGTLQY
ncbi:dihydroorotate dehydrogenase [Clostridia bacterium OttesenSCG-928-F22]|nr:dihydroorotate dehydrogenase [Clostridia bacterium OttesenSCG-928-F22]